MDITLHLRTDPGLLCSVRALTTRYVGEWLHDDSKTKEIVLAIDEACTNAIRHAYNNDPNQTITLRFTAMDRTLEIQVEDRGHTAPAVTVQRKTPAPPDPETISPGGLGVQLIHEVFDEVDWCPGTPTGNCVRMRLYKK